jgi:6-phosphogluconolactonase (cycloisomerase 2 family)
MSSGPIVSRREFLATTAMLSLANSASSALPGPAAPAAPNAPDAAAAPDAPAAPAAPAAPDAPAAPAKLMYIGSFTGEGRGHGEGLSVFERTAPTGRWSRIQLLDKIADPSYLGLDRTGRYLYSAHGGGEVATSYSIDQSTGKLTVLNQQPTKGVNGVYVAIDATGRYLALPNYATGSLVVFPLNKDGTLGPVSDLAKLEGEPGPHRTQQTESHPHACPFDRAGRFIIVPDKGLDKTFLFRLDPSAGKLVPANPPFIASRSGAAPRHADTHPTLPYLYVNNEIDSTIAACHFEPDKGVMTPFQVITTLPTSYTGNNSTAEIWLAASGRFLYVSNRGHDSIAIFAINQKSGELSPIGWEPTQGRTPRYFGLSPAGDELYAANQNSDTVVVFRVNRATGKLTATGEIIKVASPTTIVFR